LNFVEFVRNVYLLVAAQLFVTFSFCLACSMLDEVKVWIQSNIIVGSITIVSVLFVTVIAYICFPILSTHPVGKWVFLVLFVSFQLDSTAEIVMFRTLDLDIVWA
jgi:hypothetical protein